MSPAADIFGPSFLCREHRESAAFSKEADGTDRLSYRENS